jgi:hypothetical protein
MKGTRAASLPYDRMKCHTLLDFPFAELAAAGWRSRSIRVVWLAQRLLANEAAAAGEFAPVDPAMVHPVVEGRAADPDESYCEKNRKELRFFLAMRTQETRSWPRA